MTVSLRPRRGFALLSVLAVIVGVAALGARLSMDSRESIGAATNRVELLRASWLAEGCIERLRATIGDELLDVKVAARAWDMLDSVVAASPLVAGCDLSLYPAGTSLNVNATPPDRLRALLRDVGVAATRADSMVDALTDWIDADDVPLPAGAETEWYRTARRPAPRNGELASIEELRLVRGFEDALGLDSLLGTDTDRIVLERAPLAVLRALPGMTPQSIATIVARRSGRHPIGDLAVLANTLDSEPRETLLRHYAQLVAQTSPTPEHWTVRSHVTLGSPAVSAAIEVRLVRAGSRVAIVRRRE